MIWGLKILRSAQKTRLWPSVSGTITISQLNNEDDELLPKICFNYQVNDAEYNNTLQFPADTTPSKELSQTYVDRYPAGAQVEVYYNHQQPDQATLEPGGHPGDWLVFLFGLGATILMLYAWLTQ